MVTILGEIPPFAAAVEEKIPKDTAFHVARIQGFAVVALVGEVKLGGIEAFGVNEA